MIPSRSLVFCALAAVAWTSTLHAQSLLVRGGTLIDGTGRSAIQDAQILIRDGMIAEVRYFFCAEIDLPGTDAQQRPAVERRGLDSIRKPEEAVAIVKHLKDRGIDCIKLDENFSRELFIAIARAAHASGMKVISHSLNAADSVQWGIDGIEHMVGIAVATAVSPRAKEAVGRLRLEAGHKNSSLYQWMEPPEFDRLIQDLVSRHVFINPTLSFEWKALSERTQQHEREDLLLFNTPPLSYFLLDGSIDDTGPVSLGGQSISGRDPSIQRRLSNGAAVS